MGDVFLTEAVAVLMEMQNQNRDELYLFSEYDPQPYYPKLLESGTFASQICNQLYTALEEHNRLPSAIILVFGNKHIDNMVMNPENTRRVWNAFLNKIQRTIKTRKEDLPKKAQIQNEPRVLIANVFPRSNDHLNDFDKSQENFKTKRRRLNGLLPTIAKNFEYDVLSISGILPERSELFMANTGQLNGKGIRQYWTSLSSELRVVDCKQDERHKSAIIDRYFEYQREERRINQERRKIVKDRMSMPRVLNNSARDRDNSERGHNNRKPNRSRSVPAVSKGKNQKQHR